MMSDRVGKAHFLLTFVFLNGTFFPMHFLGPMPRRLADPYVYDSLKGLLPLNQFITMCALAMGVAQLLFVGNFFFSLRWGKSASRNPWRANSLEWTTASPPPRNNFQQLPIVKRDPYQFSHPERDEDFWPQSDNQ
jgi:cytochrome c oxidase subunit 1